MCKTIVQQIRINDFLRYQVEQWTLDRDFIQTKRGSGGADRGQHRIGGAAGAIKK